jgi:hypothetical protein
MFEDLLRVDSLVASAIQASNNVLDSQDMMPKHFPSLFIGDGKESKYIGL